MAIKAALVFLAMGGALVWSACSGDGSTLGPDGTPATNGADIDDDGNGNAVTVTLTELKTDIFTQRCGPCHLGASPSGNMSLTNELIWEETVDVPAIGNADFMRVDPGDLDNSYIVMKLRGDSRISGRQMPSDGTAPLDDADITRIATWIAEGALDN